MLTITETNRMPQTNKMVISAYVGIKIYTPKYISYEYAKRVAAETETEETA